MWRLCSTLGHGHFLSHSRILFGTAHWLEFKGNSYLPYGQLLMFKNEVNFLTVMLQCYFARTLTL